MTNVVSMHAKLFNRRTTADGGKRRKRWSRSRILVSIVAAGTVVFGVASIFAFRGVSYLSDGTFLISMFPFAAIALGLLVLAANVYLLRRRKTRTRIGLTALSSLAVLSLVGNSIAFAVTSGRDEAPTAAVDNAAVEARLAEYGDAFTAGAAKGDITPTSNLMPMPLLSVLKFDRVVDPVHARVLAMSDGEQQSLFITLDMTLVPRADETLTFLSDETGIPRENIFIAATHTHGVTPISLFEPLNPVDRMKIDEWYGQITATLLSTVRDAQAKMVPARYGYGTGESDVNVNRDVLDGEKSVLGSNFDRPSDKTIRMMRLENLDGEPIALVVNYAVHAVVLNGLLNGIRTPFSGDLPGRTSTKLEAQLDGAVVLWNSGAAGDQNPRISTQFASSDRGVEKETRGNLGDAGLLVLEYLSDEHARDILDANASIEADRSDARLFASETATEVPSKDEEGVMVPYTLRLFAIGDVMFQGISAEIVTSIGEMIRDASPYENTVLVTQANGYQGYVADDWEYEHDAFEVGPTVQGEAQKRFLTDFDTLFDAAPDVDWLTRR